MQLKQSKIRSEFICANNITRRHCDDVLYNKIHSSRPLAKDCLGFPGPDTSQEINFACDVFLNYTLN